MSKRRIEYDPFAIDIPVHTSDPFAIEPTTSAAPRKHPGEWIYDKVEQARQLFDIGKMTYLEIGMIFLDIMDDPECRWKNYNTGYRTMDDFISDIGLCEHAQFYNLARVARIFGALLKDYEKLPPLTRLIKLAPHCRALDGEEKKKILDKALLLPKQGWDNEYNIMRGGVDRDKCEHKRFEDWRKCLDCGAFIRPDQTHVHELENEQ